MQKHTQTPSQYELKGEAIALHKALVAEGELLTHAQCLNKIAEKYGFQSWDALRVGATAVETRRWRLPSDFEVPDFRSRPSGPAKSTLDRLLRKVAKMVLVSPQEPSFQQTMREINRIIICKEMDGEFEFLAKTLANTTSAKAWAVMWQAMHQRIDIPRDPFEGPPYSAVMAAPVSAYPSAAVRGNGQLANLSLSDLIAQSFDMRDVQSFHEFPGLYTYEDLLNFDLWDTSTLAHGDGRELREIDSPVQLAHGSEPFLRFKLFRVQWVTESPPKFLASVWETDAFEMCPSYMKKAHSRLELQTGTSLTGAVLRPHRLSEALRAGLTLPELREKHRPSGR